MSTEISPGDKVRVTVGALEYDGMREGGIVHYFSYFENKYSVHFSGKDFFVQRFFDEDELEVIDG